jgi:hypothetical protein
LRRGRTMSPPTLSSMMHCALGCKKREFLTIT